MGLSIGDNFGYQGKKPNFDRDQFSTLAEMKAFPETSIDEGHVSFCAENGKHYKYKSGNTVDPVTGKWREFPSVDTALSDSSENAVQNKVVAGKFSELSNETSTINTAVKDLNTKVETQNAEINTSIQELNNNKQNTLQYDEQPTEGSPNIVNSGNIKKSLDKQKEEINVSITSLNQKLESETSTINTTVENLNTKVDENKIELTEKIDAQKNEVDAAKNEALQAIQENEQSAITNFNAQRVTPEMLSESTKQLIEASGGGTVTNLADDEDIESKENELGTNVLKLADRIYNPSNFSGKGYKILRKNIVEGKNVLTQDMVSEANTVYEIKYDFDLNGAEIIIPEGCTLKYNGGSFNNGNITSSNVLITSKEKCFSNLKIIGITGDVDLRWFTDNNVKEEFFILNPFGYSIANEDKLKINDIKDINNAIFSAKNSTTKILNGNNINIYIESPVIMTDDSYCTIKNIKIFHKVLSNNTFTIVYDGTQPYVLSNVSLINCKFYCINPNKYLNNCCVFYKKIYNTTYWGIIDVAIRGYSGYSIVNCGYLQEGILDNIHMVYCGGFITYNKNKAYYDTSGSSNILTIRECTLDSGLNELATKEIIPFVIDMASTGQVLFQKCVLQGKVSNEGIKGMRIDHDAFVLSNTVIIDGLWFEFITNASTNCIYVYSNTYLKVNYEFPTIYIEDDNSTIELNGEIRTTNTDILDRIIINDNVVNSNIIYNANKQTGASSYGDKFLNYLRRGFITTLNNNQKPFPSANPSKPLFYNIKYNESYNFRDFVCGQINTNSFLNVYKTRNVVPKMLTVDDIDVLEFSDIYTDKQYHQWLNSFKVNSIFKERKDSYFDIAYVVSILYRTSYINRGKDTTKAYLRIGDYPIIDILGEENINTNWDRRLFVYRCGENSVSTFNFIVDCSNASIQIADIQITFVNQVLNNDVTIDLINNKLLTHKEKRIYSINLTKETVSQYIDIFKDCTSCKYEIQDKIYKANNNTLVDINDGSDISKNESKVGTFNEKPKNIAIGFAYFCTDKQTTEGTTNGIMIYHKGNNVWVDALGRVVI